MTTAGTLASESEEHSPTPLVLYPVVTIGSLESSVAELFATRPVANLLLDMRQCTFVEVSALVYLISLVAKRSRQNQVTQIALPEAKRVRDFMRVWKFPEGIREATGLPFIKLVREEDRPYFGENPTHENLQYAGVTLMSGLERLVSERFFAITHIPVVRGKSRTVIVKDESARWEQRLIQSILENHLSGPKGYISSRVIYESMTNAVRHPNATFIQAASHFDVAGIGAARHRGYLTIVFWDDGDSIVDTLRRVLDEGRVIRSRIAPVAQHGFWVRINRSGDESAQLIKADFLPAAETEDALLLLSSIFPGITSDPSGRNHTVHDELTSDQELSRPGMGLFVLVNTAVDIFGGSVAFRTHHHFMNIKRAPAGLAREFGASYQVKITEFGSSFPKFLGNMITVRLPLRR